MARSFKNGRRRRNTLVLSVLAVCGVGLLLADDAEAARRYRGRGVRVTVHSGYDSHASHRSYSSHGSHSSYGGYNSHGSHGGYSSHGSHHGGIGAGVGLIIEGSQHGGRHGRADVTMGILQIIGGAIEQSHGHSGHGH